MKKIFIISLGILCYFISLISIAQNPVQNIEIDDRVIIKNFVDSLLLHHCVDSLAAKKTYSIINTRMNEGYYDKYAENSINYILQISNDIQIILKDNYFECYNASPAESSEKEQKKIDIITTRWKYKADEASLEYDSLRKAGKMVKISTRVQIKAFNNYRGWFGKVIKYQNKVANIKYKIGYNGLGVPQMQILEGNIGYLKIKSWISSKDMNMPIWTLASHYLYNTEAVILDLRDSGEGDIEAMFEFLRYFLPNSDTYLGSIYHKPSAQKQVFFNFKKHQLKPYKIRKRDKRNFENYMNQPLLDFSQLKGKNVKLLQQPIYILTDKNTSSISEYFALLLRQHRKAILVGENTAGYTYITHDYNIWAGSLRVRVPDTKILGIDSLHNKGLKVDMQSDAPLESIWFNLLQNMADSTDFSYTQSYLDGFLAYQKSKKSHIKISDTTLQNIVGNYALDKKITLDNDILYLEEFGIKKKLIAIDNNLFLLPDFYDKSQHLNYLASNGHYAGTKLQTVYVRFDKNDLGKSALFLIYFGGAIAEFEKL